MDQPAQMMQSDRICVTAQLAFNRGDLFVLICHLLMPSPKNRFPASDAGFAEASPSFIQGFDATQFLPHKTLGKRRQIFGTAICSDDFHLFRDEIQHAIGWQQQRIHNHLC